MAEAFGIAAGAVGIAQLAAQLVAGVATLRRIRRSVEGAAGQLEDLVGDLESLLLVLERVEHAAEQAPAARPVSLEQCRRGCANVVAGLQRLHCRFPVEGLDPPNASAGAGRPSLAKATRLVRFRDWKEEAEAIQRSVTMAKQDLLILMSEISMCQIQAAFDANRPRIEQSSTADDQTDQWTVMAPHQPLRRSRKNCLVRHCSCRCHRVGRVRRRFWSLDYTPLSIILQGCDVADCSAQRYSLSFRVALTQLGFPIATMLQLQYLAGGGRSSLRPALEVQHVVRNTSRGFELLWLFQIDKLSINEVVEGLREMFRENPAQFRRHISAEGLTYVTAVAQQPWVGDHDAQFQLLDLLIREFGMDGGVHDVRFLHDALQSWMGEGPHMYLVEMLIRMGWDVAEIDEPHSTEWPKPCNPNWLSEKFTDDPLYVELLAVLAAESPGYAGVASAHRLVLQESAGVDKLLRVAKLKSGLAPETFLKQTPLHFAATTSHNNTQAYITALLGAGYDVDAEDSHGITPLMYAAAMGSTPALISLLEADPLYTFDRLWKRTFLHYAVAREKWDVVTTAIETIARLFNQETVSWYATQTAIIIMKSHYRRGVVGGHRERVLAYLFTRIEDVNIPICVNGNGNFSLMHWVRSLGEAQSLVAQGFNQFNRADDKGHYPIMEACGIAKPDVVEFLLQNGADPDLTDTWGHTTLAHSLGRCDASWNSYSSSLYWRKFKAVLSYSQKPMLPDSCSCPCSESGCTAETAFDSRFQSWSFTCTRSTPICLLEYVVVLLEEKGPRVAKAAVLSLIRRALFEDLSLQHSCCRRFTSSSLPTSILGIWCKKGDDWDGQRPKKNPSNAKEKIEALEQSMEIMAQKTFPELLGEWLAILANSFTKLEGSPPTRHEKRLPSYYVDRQKDEFVGFNFSLSLGTSRAEMDWSMGIELAGYALWVEQNRRGGEGRRSLRREEYGRRIDCIRKIGRGTVGIEAVVERMKKLGQRDEWGSDLDPLDRDAHVQHFSESVAEVQPNLWDDCAC